MLVARAVTGLALELLLAERRARVVRIAVGRLKDPHQRDLPATVTTDAAVRAAATVVRNFLLRLFLGLFPGLREHRGGMARAQQQQGQ